MKCRDWITLVFFHQIGTVLNTYFPFAISIERRDALDAWHGNRLLYEFIDHFLFGIQYSTFRIPNTEFKVLGVFFSSFVIIIGIRFLLLLNVPFLCDTVPVLHRFCQLKLTLFYSDGWIRLLYMKIEFAELITLLTNWSAKSGFITNNGRFCAIDIQTKRNSIKSKLLTLILHNKVY